jgi:uncharacterized membrane protein YedE/YeeE
MMKNIIALISGLIFALGLGLSEMVKPQVVKGFLDVFGDWDFRLMGVMMGAIGVHALTYRLILKRPSPLLDTKFHVPTRKDIDGRLIWGAVLFGLGWGWSGICPGPSLVALASGELSIVYFVVSMLLGMKLFQVLEPKLFH